MSDATAQTPYAPGGSGGGGGGASPGRMIEFACRCSHRFALPDDEAGGVTQCPSCHRLVDIPNLGDLAHIDTDGNYKFDDDGTIPLAGDEAEDRLPTLHKAFTRSRTDASGEEIDLRPSMRDVLGAGTEETPYEVAEQIKPAPPKYDPVTGELIKPMDVKGGPEHVRIDPRTVPVARRAVNYAGRDIDHRLSLLRIAGRLLQPMNLFVMCVIVLVHVVLQPVNLLMLAGIFFVAPLFVLGVGLLMAHYGNVVEDTGPCERDELPRPLRDAELHADIWQPFTSVAGSVILCGWPILLALKLGAPWYVVLGVALIGAFFVPAVLLTLATSGSAVNLRPDRVIGVIGACGAHYVVIVLLLLGGLAGYALGLWRFTLDSLLLFVPGSTANMVLSAVPWWFQAWLAYFAFFAGIYLMHWFCWSLGGAYRAYHEAFPWTLQRHVPTKLRDRTRLPPDAADRRGNTNSAAVKQKLGTR
jgi:hypothetical protein